MSDDYYERLTLQMHAEAKRIMAGRPKQFLSDDDEAKAVDYLAKVVQSRAKIGPIGFIRFKPQPKPKPAAKPASKPIRKLTKR